MINNFKFFVLILCFITWNAEAQNQAVSLAQTYKDYFKIGVAVSPRALLTDEVSLITSQFNSMTPENALKMGPVHPQENQYNFVGGDSYCSICSKE